MNKSIKWVVLILFGVLFTGCAGVQGTVDKFTMNYDEQDCWKNRAGIPIEDVHLWKEAGISQCEDAAQWHTRIVSKRGNRWITPGGVARFKAAGLNATEAITCIENDFTISDAAAYKAEGISVSDGVNWAKLHQDPKHSRIWIANGIDVGDAREWIELGLDIDVSSRLQRAGVRPGLYRWFTAGGLAEKQFLPLAKNPTVLAWMNAGYPYEEASQWWRHGFTVENAEHWRDRGSLAAAKTAKEFGCSNPLGQVDLLQTNPYSVKGHCYEIVAQPIQLLSQHIGLYDIGGNTPILIDFGKTDAPPLLYQGIAKGEGIYSYTTTRGNQQIVPRMKMVTIIKLNTNGN
jgi:hypothetical protein